MLPEDQLCRSKPFGSALTSTDRRRTLVPASMILSAQIVLASVNATAGWSKSAETNAKFCQWRVSFEPKFIILTKLRYRRCPCFQQIGVWGFNIIGIRLMGFTIPVTAAIFDGKLPHPLHVIRQTFKL